MKLSLLFVAILGVASVAAVPTNKALNRSNKSLSDDWADFLALVDTDALLAVVIEYLAVDAEVQAAVTYLQSDDFKALWNAAGNVPEIIELLDWLQAAGLDVWSVINTIEELLGVRSLTRLASTRITGGVAGLWADIKALLDLDAAKALFNEKLQTSPDFANLIEILKSDKAQAVYDQVKANEEWQKIRAALEAWGLDIDRLIEVAKDLIGWN